MSVAYGKRKPKSLMSCSKEAALLEFRATQHSKFSITTLLQYWPQQFIIPTTRDRQRNVCPTHDNWPRLVQALHLVGVGENVPSSCRAAASMAQCSGEKDALDPLTWNKQCAMGFCSSCPELLVDVRLGMDIGATFTYQEWRKGLVARTNDKGEAREVFTLHNTIITINEGVKLLRTRAKELKHHIFVAYNQWEYKKICESNIQLGTVMILSDYQQNLTIELSTTPSSTVYGANQINVAIFPTVLYYKREGEAIRRKSTITFISDDLVHDHQQVWRFEARALKILQERTGLVFNRLIRVSDGCSAQFKSRFAIADLCHVGERLLGKPGATAEFVYFESNEGKSESDTAGSAVKLMVERMLLRNNNLAITCAKELVEELNKLTPDKVGKYEFTMVEEYGTFERTNPKDRDEVKLNGIRKVHQVTFNGSSLTALPLSCLSCARLQAQCDECVILPPTVPEMKLARLLRKEMRIVQDVEGVEEEQEDGMAVVSMPNDVLEQSDGEVEESSDELEGT